MSLRGGEGEGEERSCLLVTHLKVCSVAERGPGGGRTSSRWLARGVGNGGQVARCWQGFGSSRVVASLSTLRCLFSVALSARWRFSPIVTTGDGRCSLPHPLTRFIQTSSTYRLSYPSHLQRAAPSVPLNGQSHLLSLRH